MSEYIYEHAARQLHRANQARDFAEGASLADVAVAAITDCDPAMLRHVHSRHGGRRSARHEALCL